MPVRDHIERRAGRVGAVDAEDVRLRLPSSLRSDAGDVRTTLLRRLAGSRRFALGDRSGSLRAAEARSGRSFRLDLRQRVIVKALVSRHSGRGAGRASALAKHVGYLGRPGAGVDGDQPAFFDCGSDALDASTETATWRTDRHHFRFIVSPEHGDRLELRGYVREVMARVCRDLGQAELCWIAIAHYDTDQPHAHVLVRGLRADGRDLVIPRDYIGYGFRARAQEVAQERLGDLSRADAERRIWKETQADRFTGFDRRLVSEADPAGLVDDGVGATHAWAALTRGRLRHLERLGLARPEGRRYRLDDDLEPRLRTLQLRRDIVRTVNQRRLEGARDVRVLEDRVTGRVMKTGFHDEAGASAWAVIRDAEGVEYYARLRAGSRLPDVGRTATLSVSAGGLAQVVTGRSPDLER